MTKVLDIDIYVYIYTLIWVRIIGDMDVEAVVYLYLVPKYAAVLGRSSKYPGISGARQGVVPFIVPGAGDTKILPRILASKRHHKTPQLIDVSQLLSNNREKG